MTSSSDVIAPLHGDSTVEASLLDASRRGDTQAVEEFLREDADPNARNALGDTALHLAVAGRHAQSAACLLAHGASPLIANADGRTPLALDYTNLPTLHAIRQRYHRQRASDGAAGPPPSNEAVLWSNELERRGIVRLPGLVGPDALARMQADFQAFVDGLQAKVARGESTHWHYDEEQHWWDKDQAFVSNNAFRHSAELVRFCCRPALVEAARLYLRKPAFIQRGVAMRYLPAESAENNMFGWHHDMEERRFKVLILLTDVGQRDQHMSYVVGSHQLFHPLVMFLKNPCSLAYCEKQLGKVEVFHATGQAGDVFLFDSNGAHRGNRRPDARVRDAFFVEYTADKSDIWGGDVPPGALDGLSLPEPNPFARLLAAEKKWHRPPTRSVPTWFNNLPHVERWL